MSWSYKTVHFGLKKEGLLGGAFLDEVELEESLNEYGRLGWELVSLVDVQDGLMAVFKQSLNRESEREMVQDEHGVKRSGPEPVQESTSGAYHGRDVEQFQEVPEESRSGQERSDSFTSVGRQRGPGSMRIG
jgi:hypothetical protein